MSHILKTTGVKTQALSIFMSSTLVQSEWLVSTECVNKWTIYKQIPCFWNTASYKNMVQLGVWDNEDRAKKE